VSADGITRRALLGSAGVAATTRALASAEVAFPVLSIDAGAEHVYGVSYEARGAAGASIRPVSFKTYDAEGRIRQQEEVDGHGYGLFRVQLEQQWRRGTVEVFTKRGAAKLELRFAVTGSSSAEVRNVRLVDGGFTSDPPVAGPPYLDWINGLIANREIARKNPLLIFSEDGEPAWTRNSRRLHVTDEEALAIAKDAAPYLEVSPERLYELMPQRRGFDFTGGERDDPAYIWDPREPEILRYPDGRVFDFAKEYPLTGHEEVRTPSGKIVTYSYHDPLGRSASKEQTTAAWEHPKPPADRVYLDGFMTEARIHWLLRSAYNLAVLYRKTGGREYGLRAGAILGAFGRALGDYPIFGRNDFDRLRQFQSPDAYHYWFAYILHDWYLPWAGRIRIPVRTYDLLRDAPIWSDLARSTGRDLRADIESGLMHTAKLTLKYDAYFRTDPWRFFHNTMSGELTMFLEIGRALGCPELVHYAVRKIAQTFRYNFMADGMFPESTSYIEDMVGGFRKVLRASMEGYSDPPGFKALIDGTHIAAFDPRTAIERYHLAEQVLERLRFPDGSVATIHDTWTDSQLPRPKADLSPVRPFLLPEFGHAVLGGGKNPEAFEAHLHYSGYYNHGHQDALTFTLWAYGEELTADVGYDHQGAYKTSTVSHNLVVVDGEPQGAFGVHRGDLLAWASGAGGVQIAQAAAHPNTYPSADRYRRAVIAVPFGPGRDAIVDIFEVRGGSRHEWMVNGSADHSQNVETNLKFEKTAESLAPDGSVFQRNDVRAPDPPGRPSVYYGTFRNAQFASNRRPWHVTLHGESPHAGLRVNWLSPSDGEVILCEAPRNRFSRPRELSKKISGEEWARERMRKIIVRRSGVKMESMFAAVWEPFRDAPWIERIDRIEEIPPASGFGVAIQAARQRVLVLYRTPENRSALETAQLTARAHFAVLRDSDGEHELDVYDGVEATTGELTVKLSHAGPAAVVSAQKHVLVVAGRWSGQPDWIRLNQEGQSSIWLPVERMESAERGQTRVILTRDCGLEWDPHRWLLHERAFPHRTLSGALNASLPQRATVRWNAKEIRVRSNGGIRVEWKGREVQLRPEADGWLRGSIQTS
jgi:hypothetical protein